MGSSTLVTFPLCVIWVVCGGVASTELLLLAQPDEFCRVITFNSSVFPLAVYFYSTSCLVFST
jgi:hypothetical protein